MQLAKANKNTLLRGVLAAIILAVIIGYYSQGVSIGGLPLAALYEMLGQLFLNALTMIVIPLVASSLIAGIGGITLDRSFGRLGLKTFFYYIVTIMIAVLIGVGIVSLVSFDQFKPALDKISEMPTNIQLPSSGYDLVKQILFKIFSGNIFLAASQGNMLGIILFSVLFGLGLSKIKGPSQASLLSFWQGFSAVMMSVTHIIMKCLPFGVFFLVARTVASGGLTSFSSIGFFLLIVLLGLALFLFIALPILLYMRGVSPLKYFKAVSPALVTAFSTSSSAATLPITMECVQINAGVSNRICSFVIPLGTTVNMTGSALYECVAVLFIAAMLGIDLTLIQQAMVVFLSLLTAMGMAGIPSASLISLIIILNTLGLPAESIALIVPVERILDMFRTVVNVASEAGCAIMVARWEGENVLPR